MAFSIDHVGVVVRDLDESVAAFSAVFGWIPIGPAEQLPDVGVTVAYLRNDRTGPMVQFVSPAVPGPLRDFIADHGGGVHHLCFAVEDIHEAVARLAPGASVTVVRGGRGRLACFLPEVVAGIRIELTEARPSFGGDDGTA